jgi:hypothetical protein
MVLKKSAKYVAYQLKKLQLNIVAWLPLVKGAAADALEGKIYIKDNTLINGLYKKQMARIIDMILTQN